MKMDRTKNASRNMVFGVLLKLYQIICPFIIRTAMIYILGMEYVGLNSLFAAILQILNMTELGVGTAMVFSMYKPVAEDDYDTICRLMQLYKVYYRIIGIIIAVIGLVITPIVPKLISQDTSITLNIYYLFWLNLGYTVLSYWLFAYKNSILLANQRTDVISKVTLVTNTITYVVQLLLLVLFKNYYYYLICMLLGQALNNVVTAIVADRMYPHLKAQGKLEKEKVRDINQRVKDLFTSKVGGVVQNSADSIVISAFLGLNILAKYNNYYYIMNSIFGFITIIFSSCLAGIGNSIVLESDDKNYNDLKKIAFITEWIAGFCGCCLLCLYQPFMKLWVGEENLISMGAVVCISIYLVIIITNQMLCLYKDGSGMWHEDRLRPLITALANLAMNLLTVKFWGLYGVVLSTVISMTVIGMPWLIHNLFVVVFKRSCKEFVGRLLLYVIVSGCIGGGTWLCCSTVRDDGIVAFVLKVIICVIVPNVSFLIIYCRMPEFNEALNLINRITGNRISRICIQSKFFKM